MFIFLYGFDDVVQNDNVDQRVDQFIFEFILVKLEVGLELLNIYIVVLNSNIVEVEFVNLQWEFVKFL